MGSIQINSNQLNSYATGRSIYLTKNKHSPQAGRQIEGLHQNTVQTSFKSKLKFSICEDPSGADISCVNSTLGVEFT